MKLFINTLLIRLCFFTIINIVFVCTVKAQNWQPVGTDDYNEPAYARTTTASIAVTPAGTPYIIIADTLLAYRATVRKYDGGTWVNVGTPGFSEGAIDNPGITIDGNGIPYIVYVDAGNGYKAMVKKFNGSRWVDVGAAGISAGMAAYTKIVIDKSGAIYIVYVDVVNNNKATVKEYTGDNWADVGMAGISAGYASYTSIAIDGNGTPYIAYMDGSNGGKAAVKKYTGGSWAEVGTPGISAGIAAYTSIAVDGNNVPYLAYAETSNIWVWQFNGTGWAPMNYLGTGWNVSLIVDNRGQLYLQYVTTSGVAIARYSGVYFAEIGESQVMFTSPYYAAIAVDSSGTVYSSYSDNTFKAVVRKYNGTGGWVTVGQSGFGKEGVYVSMAVANNGAVYAVYRNNSFINPFTYRYWMVRKSDSASWVSPVPVTSRSDFPVSIAVDSNGISYVAYIETHAYAGMITVAKLDGVGSVVGKPGFTNYTDWVRLAIGKANTPYVAYPDNMEYGGKATVKKFDGTNWVNVGTAGFSAGTAKYIAFAIDTGGMPYIAYRDGGNAEKLTVKKYDGTDWTDVGTAGFSAGAVNTISLAINNRGVPYVLYGDEANNNIPTVKKFDGNNWVNIVTAGFLPGTVNTTSFAINKAGNLYVSYVDSINKRASVIQFDGSTWVNIGGTGISAGVAATTCLGIGANDAPIIMYAYMDVYAKTMVAAPALMPLLQFTGNLIGRNVLLKWKTAVTANNSPFIIERSTDNQTFNNIATLAGGRSSGRYWLIDPDVVSLYVPVIYYRLQQKDGSGNLTTSNVLAIPITKPKAGIYFHPNPFCRLAFITITTDEPQPVVIRVIDYTGRIRLLLQRSVSAGTVSLPLDMSHLTNGIYFLDVKGTAINQQLTILKQ